MNTVISRLRYWRNTYKSWTSLVWLRYEWQQQRRRHGPVRAALATVREHFQPLPF